MSSCPDPQTSRDRLIGPSVTESRGRTLKVHTLTRSCLDENEVNPHKKEESLVPVGGPVPSDRDRPGLSLWDPPIFLGLIDDKERSTRITKGLWGKNFVLRHSGRLQGTREWFSPLSNLFQTSTDFQWVGLRHYELPLRTPWGLSASGRTRH